jgi:hypothetical protein
MALDRGIPVIPVLVRRAIMPSSTDLPLAIRSLAYCNGISVRSDPDFHRDMDRLIEQIELLNPNQLGRESCMEPITTIVESAIATYILPEAFKEGGKALGKGASEKVDQLINAISSKFTESGIAGLLTRVKEKPTEDNIKKVKDELEEQMNKDSDFANTLRELVKLLQLERVIPVNCDNKSNSSYTFNAEVKGSAFGENARVDNKW